jgi:uncharacterized protein (TIGR00369 family)
VTDVDARADSVFAIPFHRFLGIRPIDPADPPAGIVLPATDAAINNAQVVHGGIVTALLDVASYLAILPHLQPGRNAVTHDITASLMRPVPEGAEVRLVGTVVRVGRSLAFLRAEATVDGTVVATAQVTKSMVPSG